MKRILSVLLLLAAIMSTNAQTDDRTCHFGLTFEISNNPNWGYGEPVVLTVENNSPAEKAGVKPGDIIMEINGTATYLRNYQTIASWLFNSTSDIALFTIRNLNSYFKEYELPRQCRSVNSLSESDLATSFSFYSLENTQERDFILPLRITTNKDADYSDYHTFNFIKTPNAPDVDNYINSQIEQVLLAKGLVRDDKDPDIMIQTNYSYQPNPKYTPLASKNGKSTWRYDIQQEQMVLVPILSGNNPNAEKEGQFILELGIRFFDRKYMNSENPTLIWEANVREFLSDLYTLDKYIYTHAPLIMMQFPYSGNKSTCRYVVSFQRYNYTGLYFNMNDMKTITDVDRNSPAYKAGLRAGDVIEKIDNQQFSYNKNELMNGYKRFIIETMEYRDPSTKFTDAKGYPDCMYWSKRHYPEIRKAFSKSIYVPTFSYLYNFERYVSNNQGKPLQVNMSRGAKKKSLPITPIVKSSVAVRAF